MLVELEYEQIEALVDECDERISHALEKLVHNARHLPFTTRNPDRTQILNDLAFQSHLHTFWTNTRQALSATKSADDYTFAKLPEWTSEDDNAAEREGWVLVNYPEAPELQKDDAAERFESDNNAIRYVTGKALSEDLTEHADRARRALALHYLADAYAERRRQDEA